MSVPHCGKGKAQAVTDLQVGQAHPEGPVTLTWERQGASYKFRTLHGLAGCAASQLALGETTRETTIHVAGLAAGTVYCFCVETVPIKGEGPRCEPVTFRTLAGRPRHAPHKVSQCVYQFILR